MHYVRIYSDALACISLHGALGPRHSDAELTTNLLQLCTTLCTAQPGNYNAKKLIDNGSKLPRSAFGLDEVLLGPECGHSDAVSECWYDSEM
jgi:hypothetical protein